MHRPPRLRHSTTSIVASRFNHNVMPTVDPLTQCVLVPLVADTDIQEIAGRLSASGVMWIGWNIDDDPYLAVEALQAGAKAVFPAQSPPERLLRSVLPTGTSRCIEASSRVLGQQGIERSVSSGIEISLPPNTLIEVRDGILCHEALHDDGRRLLLGFAGPGEVLVVNDDSNGDSVIRAHTPARFSMASRTDGWSATGLLDRLTRRLAVMAAWSTAVAHPHLDMRLLGILRVLAGQFGRPHEAGVLIDIRLTHAHLASAIGANRTTVTRLVGELRHQSSIAVIHHGDMDRFWLPRDSGRPTISARTTMPVI